MLQRLRMSKGTCTCCFLGCLRAPSNATNSTGFAHVRLCSVKVVNVCISWPSPGGDRFISCSFKGMGITCCYAQASKRCGRKKSHFPPFCSGEIDSPLVWSPRSCLEATASQAHHRVSRGSEERLTSHRPLRISSTSDILPLRILC